jgi:hypothetical protein
MAAAWIGWWAPWAIWGSAPDPARVPLGSSLPETLGIGQEASPMEVIALTFGLFALAMVGMSIGVIVSNRTLAGSCGGIAALEDGQSSCGACGKKAAEMCPTDDDLVRLAQIAHPNPSHHH